MSTTRILLPGPTLAMPQSQDAQALVIAQRMLRRLPPSLWDQALETPQGKIYQAIAEELSLWLTAWKLVRQCTLLQEADGIDLDILLRDYALKRFNQRPDAYARQIARQILGTPKGTLYGLQQVSQLLTDSPQLLGRSGRLQPHWWVAISRPITMPRTYWQFGSGLGVTWYLSLEENDLIFSTYPPPGANVTPWPDGVTPPVPAHGDGPFADGWEDVPHLYWCQVPDDTDQLWYLSVGIGGSAELSLERPGPEAGTAQPLHLLDGIGEVWGLTVDEITQSLRLTPLSTPQRVPSYCQVRDTTGEAWLLAVIDGVCILHTPPAPLGWQDATPGGVPLDWFALTHAGRTVYMVIHAEDLFELQPTEPAGTGTAELLIVRDLATLQLWEWGLDTTGRAIELRPADEPIPLSGAPIIALDPGIVAEYLALNDQDTVPWYLWHAGADIALSDEVPVAMTNATPAGGPFTWWRVPALDGSASAVWPTVLAEGACLAVSQPAPAGPGTALPQAMGDSEGTLWHYGIAPDGSLGISDWPPVDFDDSATCLVMNDEPGGRWYWSMNHETSELICSAVLDTRWIPWQRLGEIGALSAVDPLGGPSRYVMAEASHEASTRYAPALGQPWSLDAFDCPIFDGEDRFWTLTIEGDGSIKPIHHMPEDIPPLEPVLYARDCIEALRHVEAAGNITTLWVV